MCKFCRAGLSSAQISSALPACTVVRLSAFHAMTSSTLCFGQSARDRPSRAHGRGGIETGPASPLLVEQLGCARSEGRVSAPPKSHLHCLHVQSLDCQHCLLSSWGVQVLQSGSQLLPNFICTACKHKFQIISIPCNGMKHPFDGLTVETGPNQPVAC